MLPEVPQTNDTAPAAMPGVPSPPPVAPSQSSPVPAAMAGAVPVPMSAPAPLPSAQSENEVEQLAHLVEQYRHDPYKLSAAVQQFKSQYLAKKFNISADTAEQ